MKKKLLLGLICALLVIGIAVPTKAAEPDTTYGYLSLIVDDADILTDAEEEALSNKAYEISKRYNCATFIITVDDFWEFDTAGVYKQCWDCADDIYQTFDLGFGAERDGEMLLLSMKDRDYAILAHGSFGNATFTDYGKEKMSEHFVEKFHDNDWYGGFMSYLDDSEMYLSMSTKGTPFDIKTDPANIAKGKRTRLLITFLVPLVIAFIYCTILKAQMKSVAAAVQADDYVPQDSINISHREDRYTHTTETRRKIEKSSSSGGTSVGSSGSSGGSGKF